MEIKYIIQKSTKLKGFWQPIINADEDGTVTLQPTTFYFQDLEIDVPKETWEPQKGDRIYIENDTDPVHLIQYGSEEGYSPLSGEKETSPGAVIWAENDTIYILTHEEG